MVNYDGKRKEIITQTILIILLGGFCVLTIYPFLNIFAKSFSSGQAMIGQEVGIIPVGATLENYKTIFLNDKLLTALFVSIKRTLIGTGVHVGVVGLCAYALSKKHIKGRKILILFFLIPMYFSGGLLPNYMLVRNLHLMNNFWVYIFPAAFSTFNFLLMVNFFMQIPETYEEAAKIDGASDLTVFYRIIIPLSAPIIATVALFIAVYQWNSWFDSLLYITRTSLYSLQTILQNIIKSNQASEFLNMAQYGMTVKKVVNVTPDSIRMATLCFTIIPIMLVYPFLQKYFVKGIMIGGIKE